MRSFAAILQLNAVVLLVEISGSDGLGLGASVSWRGKSRVCFGVFRLFCGLFQNSGRGCRAIWPHPVRPITVTVRRPGSIPPWQSCWGQPEPSRKALNHRRGGVGPGSLRSGRARSAGLHDRAKEMNGGLILLALAALPLVGFPVSGLARHDGRPFSACRWAWRWSRCPLPCNGRQLRRRAGARNFFAAGSTGCAGGCRCHHRSLTLSPCFLPGAPYIAQNYVLAVVGVPFASSVPTVPDQFRRGR